jgi:hypothetical protein
MLLLNIHAAHPEMFVTQVTCMVSHLLFLHAQQLYPTESFHRLGHPMTIAMLRGAIKETHTVGYARTNVIGSRTSFVIASVRSGIH